MIPPTSGQDQRDDADERDEDEHGAQTTDDDVEYDDYASQADPSESVRSNVLMRSLFFGMIVGGVLAGITSIIKSAVEYQIIHRGANLFSQPYDSFYELLFLRFIEHWIYFTLALFLGSVVLGAAVTLGDRIQESTRQSARLLRRAISRTSRKRRNRRRARRLGEKSAQKIVAPLVRDLNAENE